MFKAHHVTCLQKGLELQNIKCYDVVRMRETPSGEKEGSWGWYLRPFVTWLLLTSYQTHLSLHLTQDAPYICITLNLTSFARDNLSV